MNADNDCSLWLNTNAETIVRQRHLCLSLNADKWKSLTIRVTKRSEIYIRGKEWK